MSYSGYILLKVVDNAPKHVKIKIYKIMNGTTVSIKNKRYRSKGLIKNVNGVVLSGSLYLIPSNNILTVLDVLSQKGLTDFTQIINLCNCMCR